MHSMKVIEIVKLRARLNGAGGNGLIPVDVRAPAETGCDVILWARHIPPHTLPLSVHEMPHENVPPRCFIAKAGRLRPGLRLIWSLRGGISGLATGRLPRGLASSPRTARFQDIPCNILTI